MNMEKAQGVIRQADTLAGLVNCHPQDLPHAVGGIVARMAANQVEINRLKAALARPGYGVTVYSTPPQGEAYAYRG